MLFVLPEVFSLVLGPSFDLPCLLATAIKQGDARKPLEVMNMFISQIVVMYHKYIHMPKLTKLYKLIMCSVSYTNYIHFSKDGEKRNLPKCYYWLPKEGGIG